MGWNGNELSGAIREWEWFFKCINFGNGNGKDLAATGGIGNTENHSRTSRSHASRSGRYESYSVQQIIILFITKYRLFQCNKLH